MSTYESLGVDLPGANPYVQVGTTLVTSAIDVWKTIETLKLAKSQAANEVDKLKIQEQIVKMQLEYARLTAGQAQADTNKLGDTAKNVALIGGAAALGLAALSQV